MNVYFISGLGADRRAFHKIQLSEAYSVHHIDWIDPLPHESLSDYAQRLLNQVNTTLPFSLVGFSLGGVIAIEMTKFVRPEKLIVISSITGSQQLPKKLRLVRDLNLHRFIPAPVYKNPTKLLAGLLGGKTKSDKKLLHDMWDDSSQVFLKWAVDRFLNWKNERTFENLYHVHGSKDRLLPISCVRENIAIPDAGHLTVLTHAPVLIKILERELSVRKMV